MNQRIADTVSDLEEATAEAQVILGSLSDAELNWKPSDDSWSVAQCLDHLITSHGMYVPLLESLARGDAPNTWWERWSPFSALFGRMLIQAVDPDNRKKSKTPAVAQPSASAIESGILDRYSDHQGLLIARLKALPLDIDLDRIVTSPMLGLITYSLDDTLHIFVKHTRRHLRQAIRVVEWNLDEIEET